jgi:DNA-binding CsgD family transcriptional regulator
VSSQPFVEVVEAAYRIELPEHEWLLGIATAAQAAIRSPWGVLVNRFSKPGADTARPLWDPVCAEVEDALLRDTFAAFAATPPGETSQVLSSGVATVSEALGLGAAFREHEVSRRFIQPHGAEDMLWITVPDPTGHSLGLGFGLPEITRVPKRTRRHYARLGAHLTTAFRLRRRFDADRLQSRATEPAVTFDYQGLVQDVRDAAANPSDREALRAAAVAIDRARGELRERAPHEAMEIWNSMVQGRWSVIDRFDHGGRRYYVAHRNEAVSEPLSELTAMERLVAEYAALGHSNKFIAYELGLSASSVATYLRRSIRKLGAVNRLGLVRRLKRS